MKFKELYTKYDKNIKLSIFILLSYFLGLAWILKPGSNILMLITVIFSVITLLLYLKYRFQLGNSTYIFAFYMNVIYVFIFLIIVRLTLFFFKFSPTNLYLAILISQIYILVISIIFIFKYVKISFTELLLIIFGECLIYMLNSSQWPGIALLLTLFYFYNSKEVYASKLNLRHINIPYSISSTWISNESTIIISSSIFISLYMSEKFPLNTILLRHFPYNMEALKKSKDFFDKCLYTTLNVAYNIFIKFIFFMIFLCC